MQVCGLFVADGIGEELFESGKRVRVVFGEVFVYAGVGEDAFEVSARGGQVEDVIAVVGTNAFGVLEHLLGLLLHHCFLRWLDVSRPGRSCWDEQFVARPIEECPHKPSRAPIGIGTINRATSICLMGFHFYEVHRTLRR